MSLSDYLAKERKEAFESSFAAGRREVKLEVVIRMLEYDCAIDLIASVTGLTAEKIFELSQRIKPKKKTGRPNEEKQRTLAFFPASEACFETALPCSSISPRQL